MMFNNVICLFVIIAILILRGQETDAKKQQTTTTSERRLTIRNHPVVKETVENEALENNNHENNDNETKSMSRERLLQETPIKQLWMIHPNHTSPSMIVVFVTKGYYLVYDTYANMRLTWEADEILEWKREYKYDSQTPMKFPVIVHTVPEMSPEFSQTVSKYTIGPDTFIVRDANNITILQLAAIPYVLWIDEYLPLHMYSRAARVIHYSSELSPPSVPTGAPDIIIAIADEGIDPSHCAFYDPEVGTVTTGQMAPGPHSKIASMFTSVPGLTSFYGVNGAHGPAVCGAAAGFDCTSNVGMGSKTRIAFYGFAPVGGEIYLPTSEQPGVMTYYDYLTQVLTIGQAMMECLR